MPIELNGDDNRNSIYPTPWVEVGTVGAAQYGAGVDSANSNTQVLCRQLDEETYEIRGSVAPNGSLSNPVIFILPSGLTAKVPASPWLISDVQYKDSADAFEDRHLLRATDSSADISYFGTTPSGRFFWCEILVPIQ